VLPEIAPLDPFCHNDPGFITRLSGLAAYTLPKVDVLVSGTFQSIPGPQITANYVVTNAIAAPSLRRPFAGNVSNQTYNIVPPTTMYGERLNQLDLRFGKSIRVASTRLLASVDVYNAFNANPVLTLSNTFTTWLTPQSILTPRFVKFSVQYDF
jgi:hypothetical protein